MKKYRTKIALMLAVCIVTITTIINGCGKSEDKKLMIGVLSTVDSVPLYIGFDEGLYETCGLDVELVEFSSASDQSKSKSRHW